MSSAPTTLTLSQLPVVGLLLGFALAVVGLSLGRVGLMEYGLLTLGISGLVSVALFALSNRSRRQLYLHNQKHLPLVALYNSATSVTVLLMALVALLAGIGYYMLMQQGQLPSFSYFATLGFTLITLITGVRAALLGAKLQRPGLLTPRKKRRYNLNVLISPHPRRGLQS